MRRLGELGDLAFESVTEPAKVRARFEELLILEAAGWKGKKHTALVSSDKTMSFAKDLVRARAEAGAVRIDSLRLDRRPIAMVVTFTLGATAWTWKIAYAEEFARFSPGAQLMLEMPKHVFADGRIEQIDSLAVADHPMIDHLWPDRISIGTLVVSPSGGSYLHRLGLAGFKAETAARSFVHGLRARASAHRKHPNDRENQT